MTDTGSYYLPHEVMVTSQAPEDHCPFTSANLYCWVSEEHVCEQLAQSRYLQKGRKSNPQPQTKSQVQHNNHYTTMLQCTLLLLKIFTTPQKCGSPEREIFQKV